jgi:hypothetical protein
MSNDTTPDRASTISTPLTPAPEISPRIRPEAFRLPRPGERDPYWGLSRAWYYEAEKAGILKLIRLRKRGNIRGVTLVPYDDVAALIAKEKGGREK